jgi:hypothetical protein
VQAIWHEFRYEANRHSSTAWKPSGQGVAIAAASCFRKPPVSCPEVLRRTISTDGGSGSA